LSERSFSAFLHENEDTYNLEATNNVYIGNGRRVRGFVGIELLQNHHPY
jgi:putative DNA primase/helicase